MRATLNFGDKKAIKTFMFESEKMEGKSYRISLVLESIQGIEVRNVFNSSRVL